MTIQLRLNVFLQEAGVASRRKSDEIIAEGRVTVNGEVITQLGTKIPSNAIVCVDKKKITLSHRPLTCLFYKPKGFITSRNDPQGRPIIFDIPALQKLPHNVQSIGRLDFQSEGLLILTNDGDLAYKLTHPKFSLPKVYYVQVAQIIEPDKLAFLQKGFMLEDGFAKPYEIKILRKQNLGQTYGHLLKIILTEGRNRLIRRMMQRVGLTVLQLKRVAIGEIILPAHLKQGNIKPVNEKESLYLQKIKKFSSPKS